MTNPRIIGLGEILWDVFPDGRRLGGAPTNFAYHAHGMGASTALVTAVGNDVPGRDIQASLADWGIDQQYVYVDPDHPTGSVTVRLDANGVPQYVIHEDVAWDHIPERPELLQEAAHCDAVCFGTLCQRSPVSRSTIQAFLRATLPDCLRVCDVNLRAPFYSPEELESLLAPANVLKLNDAELPIVAEILGLDARPSETAPRLLERLDLRLLALTRGGEGSILFSRDQISVHPGYTVPVVDTVGAGDAFTAALVKGLLAEKSLMEINFAANRVAANVCSHAGGTPPIYGPS